ncbi:MAG: phosphoglucomutase/phosphomannomutase family protein [Candidatus Omnitrophota bacterium]
MPKKIKFGTDGWRGVISKDFTFENVKAVAQATGMWINSKFPKAKRKVVVGYDTRLLSDRFAESVACVLAANGIKVLLSDRAVPTPAVSFTTKKKRLCAGIMITASHNPARFNGYKIKISSGGAAPKSVTERVEKLIFKTKVKELSLGEAIKKNEIKLMDITKDYVKFIRSYLDIKKMKTLKCKVLVDVMYGSGNGYIAEVLKGTKIKVELMRNQFDPSFGGKQPEPVEENVKEILSRMKKEEFDIGLILDGDADRIAAAAPGGRFISPQRIIGLLALHLIEDRGYKGGIIKTIAGSTLQDNVAKYYSLKLYETSVGFKYISDLMVKKSIVIGGEEAGGIGFKNYIPERDGTLAGLLLLEMLAFRKKPFSKVIKDMENKFGRYFYLRGDLKLKGKAPNVNRFKSIKKLLGKKVVEIKDYDGVKLVCEDESWLMFRASGTEPLVRVYAEAKSLAKSKRLIALGQKLIKKL